MKSYLIIFGLYLEQWHLSVQIKPSDHHQNSVEQDERMPVGQDWRAFGQVFEDGEQKEEAWEYFHDNGKLRAKGSYIKGKKDGNWLTFFNNGKIRSQEVYEDGVQSGVWKFYYRSGNIRTEEEYKDNNLEGIWRFYLESGELIESGYQKNGVRDGILEIFDKSCLLYTSPSPRDS